MNTFTLEGTLKDLENNPMVGEYVSIRVKNVGTDVEDNVTYPRKSKSFGPTDANGDLPSSTLWINGDSGTSCVYVIKMPDGERVEVVIPSNQEGLTLRLEDIIENYQVDESTQQSTVLGQALAYTDLLASNPENNSSFNAAAVLLWKSGLGLEIGTDVQAHSDILDATTASFTTAEETKLAGIEALAEVNDVTTVLDADIGVTVQAHNSILDTIQTTITDVDTAIPTSGAVAGYVTSAVGGTGSLIATNNLSDVASEVASRANLGVSIGADVQAYDADLTTLGAGGSAARSFLAYTTPNVISVSKGGTDTRTGLDVHDIGNPFLTCTAALAAATVEGVTVASAGSTAVNLDYDSDGSFTNGKQGYTNSTFTITWSGTQWEIKSGATIMYVSATDSTYPWDATGWAVSSGSLTVPTLTRRCGDTIKVFAGDYTAETELGGKDGVNWTIEEGALSPSFNVTSAFTFTIDGDIGGSFRVANASANAACNGDVADYIECSGGTQTAGSAGTYIYCFSGTLTTGNAGTYVYCEGGTQTIRDANTSHDGTDFAPIYLLNTGTLTIWNSRIESTESAGKVVDIAASWSGTFIAKNCDFVNTTASSIGISYGATVTGDVQLKDCTIITGAGGKSIDAPSAQTVYIQGALNQTHAVDADITLTGGATYTNTNYTA